MNFPQNWSQKPEQNENKFIKNIYTNNTEMSAFSNFHKY